MIHSRNQWPVGQGFFHTGSISEGGKVLHYVYDCGSNNLGLIREWTREYVQTLDDAGIDFLFLSHFHKDHVNGVDTLMTIAKTHWVVLPYLSPLLRLMLIAKAINHNEIEWSYISFLCDPTQWLSDRGATSIIYVQPPSDENTPNWLNISPLPTSDMNDNAEINAISLHKKMLNPFVSKKDNMQNSSSTCDVYMTYCNSPFRLTTGPGNDFPILNWQFVTFVHNYDTWETIFRAKVESELSEEMPSIDIRDFAIPQSGIKSVLKDNKKRKNLGKCYAIIDSNLNFTSMSLYAGPILRSDAWDMVYTVHERKIGVLYDFSPHDLCRVAWIATGDDDLSDDSRCNAWLRHFNDILHMVHTMTLPHHGSRRNFNAKLVNLPMLWCATASTQNSYNHPHPDVIAQLPPSSFVHVSEDIKSHMCQYAVQS